MKSTSVGERRAYEIKNCFERENIVSLVKLKKYPSKCLLLGRKLAGAKFWQNMCPTKCVLMKCLCTDYTRVCELMSFQILMLQKCIHLTSFSPLHVCFES